MNRFQRLELLIGADNLSKLKAATVAIFGVGGVGSFTVEALARSGVGHLVLIDKDNVDETNINRQIHALSSTVGRSKVEVMRDRIFDINPSAQVDTIHKFFLPSEPVEDFFICRYDYVVDAIDTLTAKIFLVEECTRRGIKIISSMGAGNKLDATRFRVGDIFQTSVDPVAKIMRKKLKERGIKSLKVVWSDEKPKQCVMRNAQCVMRNAQCVMEKQLGISNAQCAMIGSVAFVPSVAGLIIAGEVVKDLIKELGIRNEECFAEN